MAIYFGTCKAPNGEPLGAVKIGFSTTPDLRCKRMIGVYPFGIEMLGAVHGTFVTEKVCHMFLSEHRIGGEFFHENPPVTEFINGAIERGRPFELFEDASTKMSHEAGDILKFLRAHKITIDRVCLRLGVKPDYFDRNLRNTMYKNDRLIAAAILEAMEKGKHVRWPHR